MWTISICGYKHVSEIYNKILKRNILIMLNSISGLDSWDQLCCACQGLESSTIFQVHVSILGVVFIVDVVFIVKTVLIL